jgi:hypothetical protein
MPTDWLEEKYDALNPWERKAKKPQLAHPESLVPMPTPQIDHPLTKPEALRAASYNRWKMWFIGWDVMLAVLAGGVVFFFLSVASFGVLGSAVTVAGLVAAVGLGHYLLWGRVFARGVVRKRQRVQDQARRLETRETKSPDEFLL